MAICNFIKYFNEETRVGFKKFWLVVLFALILFVVHRSLLSAAHASDEQSITLSITPPIFKVNMKPGESWTSAVKLINNNGYPVVVYVEAVDFKSGEAGGVEFIRRDKIGGSEKYYLSQWIEVTKEPVEISAYGSKEIPFSISLPQHADPGGHYASILVGNRPTDEGGGKGSSIKTSSKLASLLLVRVAGEVREEGEIREFSVESFFSGKLQNVFNVSFANIGNVHLRPEGEIRISNMWGEPRGQILINKGGDYGNVLPASQKKWQFDWQGKSGIWDAGLMKAELLLNFGDEARQSAVGKAYFFTLNLKATLIILGVFLVVALLVIFLIKRYIRRSISQAKEQVRETAVRSTNRRDPDKPTHSSQ